MSRSVTIVVAYLMLKKGMSVSSALAYVKKCRPIAQPNYGFMRQLEEFGVQLEASRKDGAAASAEPVDEAKKGAASSTL